MVAGLSAREIGDWCRGTYNLWEGDSGTKYNIGKTEALLQKRMERQRPPVIRVEEDVTEMGGAIKYLWITIDKRLNFNEHIRNIRRKTARNVNKIVNITSKKYGRNMNFLKIIMNRVIGRAVLYGNEIRGKRRNRWQIKSNWI